MPAKAFGPRGPPPWMPGPCFNSLQKGHLKAQCLMGTTRLYPLNDVLLALIVAWARSIIGSLFHTRLLIVAQLTQPIVVTVMLSLYSK